MSNPPTRSPRWGLEVLVVLGVGLGQSAVYSVLSIVNKLTLPTQLNQQTTSMNTSATPDRPWLDLSYQVANNVFLVAPLMVALYLWWLRPGGDPRWPTWSRPRPWQGIEGFSGAGLDRRAPGRDLLGGLALTLMIGIPGLGIYLGARALNLNTSVAPANLTDHWWTIPILVIAAAGNGALEEIVMLGYLFQRLRDKGWHWATVVATSALVRGGYHLYQGFGGFIGNLLMGVVFGLVQLRFRRLWVLVVCHTLLDVGAFVGYSLLVDHLAWLR